MTMHELKVDAEIFLAIQDRTKEYEVRLNDRDFQLGDVLLLKEWDGSRFTGAGFETGPIRHILEGGKYGIADGYVILSWHNGRSYKELQEDRKGQAAIIAKQQQEITMLRNEIEALTKSKEKKKK